MTILLICIAVLAGIFLAALFVSAIFEWIDLSKNSIHQEEKEVDAKQLEDIENLLQNSMEELELRRLSSRLTEIYTKYRQKITQLLEQHPKVVKWLELEKLKQACENDITQLNWEKKLNINTYRTNFSNQVVEIIGDNSLFNKARVQLLMVWDLKYRERFHSAEKNYHEKRNNMAVGDFLRSPGIQAVIDEGCIVLASLMEPDKYGELSNHLVQFVRQQAYHFCKRYFITEQWNFMVSFFSPMYAIKKQIALKEVIEVETLQTKENTFKNLEQEVTEIANFWYTFQETKKQSLGNEIKCDLEIFKHKIEATANFFSEYPTCADKFYQDQLLEDLFFLYVDNMWNVLKLGKGWVYAEEKTAEINCCIVGILNNPSRWPLHTAFFRQLSDKINLRLTFLKESSTQLISTVEKNANISRKYPNLPADIETFYQEGLKISNQLGKYIFLGEQAQAKSFFEANLKNFRKTYFELARKYHPDKKEGSNEELFKVINQLHTDLVESWRALVEGRNHYEDQGLSSKMGDLLNQEEALLKKLIELLDIHLSILQDGIKEIKEEVVSHKKQLEDIDKRLTALEDPHRYKNHSTLKTDFFSKESSSTQASLPSIEVHLTILNPSLEQPITEETTTNTIGCE